jgi:alcohol dehydrogenase (cytochrome c)
MTRIPTFLASVFLAACSIVFAVWPAIAQMQKFTPVTDQMLRNPSPNDWLMYSRTYDAFRDSPLTQINTKNVKNLRMAWVRGLDDGVTETIPIVHDGVM